MSAIKTDQWIWGNEGIIWGFDPSHKYTFKLIEPKQGRAGCMSLQYHHEKSETWIVWRGTIWGLVVAEGKVCTRIMRRGDIQNLPTGCIHRLMGLSPDAQVLEPSTPDRHAADKSVPKDVVRLHCVLGREVSPPGTEDERRLIEQCIGVTEAAIRAHESGCEPEELNRDVLSRHGALSIPS